MRILIAAIALILAMSPRQVGAGEKHHATDQAVDVDLLEFAVASRDQPANPFYDLGGTLARGDRRRDQGLCLRE